MRTARSSSRPGGSPPGTPLPDQAHTPRDQAHTPRPGSPPGPGTPPGPDPPCGQNDRQV